MATREKVAAVARALSMDVGLLFTGVLKQTINKTGPQTMRMQGSTGNSSVSLNVFDGTIELANSAGNSVNSTVYISTNGTGAATIRGATDSSPQIRLALNWS